MTKKILIGSALSSLAMMTMGAIWWVALPFSNMVMDRAGDEGALLAAVGEQAPRTGVYFLPDFPQDTEDEEAMEAMMERHRRGPIAQIFVRAEGADPMSPATYGQGLLQFFLASLFLGFMLARAGCRSYRERLGLVMLAGLAAVCVIDFAGPIWFYHSWTYTLVNGALFDLLNFLAAGAILARFVRPDPEPTPKEREPSEAAA